MRRRPGSLVAAAVLVPALLAGGCSGSPKAAGKASGTAGGSTAAEPASGSPSPGSPSPSAGRSGAGPLPGMPPPLAANDVYAADRPGRLSPAVQGDLARIYVPNSTGNTVDVIDPATYRVVAHYPVGRLPQHVVPSYDLRTLWVNNDAGNSLTPIDPRTGRPGRPVAVEDPYNLYFTPDGRSAVPNGGLAMNSVWFQPLGDQRLTSVPGCVLGPRRPSPIEALPATRPSVA